MLVFRLKCWTRQTSELKGSIKVTIFLLCSTKCIVSTPIYKLAM